MAQVKPFRAVRYDERRAGPLEALVAPPYDVIGPAERERYRAQSPYNVVQLTLPDDEEEAKRLWAEWQEQGVLVRDGEPALWWLEQDYVGPDGVPRSRGGLVCSLRVEPYSARVILPHERTHAGPKAGRLRLLRAVRAHLEPIFLLHEGRSLVRPSANDEPLADVTEGGVRNRLWRIGEPLAGELAARLGDARLLIADGHHRYETALAFHEEEGSEESAWLLAALVATEQEGLTIFPTHRIVNTPSLDPLQVHGRPVPEGALAALQRVNTLPRERSAAVLYTGSGKAMIVEGEEGELDTALVERLGAENVTYTPRAEEAITAVDRGEGQFAFLLRPPTVEQVHDVAERGETMPQKTTYFYPKLPSGLLFLPLDPRKL